MKSSSPKPTPEEQEPVQQEGLCLSSLLVPLRRVRRRCSSTHKPSEVIKVLDASRRATKLSSIGFLRQLSNWFQLNQAKKAWPDVNEGEIVEGAKQAFLFIHNNVMCKVGPCLWCVWPHAFKLSPEVVDEHKELFSQRAYDELHHGLKMNEMHDLKWDVQLRELKGAQLVRFGFDVERPRILALATIELLVDEKRTCLSKGTPIWVKDGPVVHTWKLSSPIFQMEETGLEPIREQQWVVAS